MNHVGDLVSIVVTLCIVAVVGGVLFALMQQRKKSQSQSNRR